MSDFEKWWEPQVMPQSHYESTKVAYEAGRAQGLADRLEINAAGDYIRVQIDRELPDWVTNGSGPPRDSK